MFDKQKQQAGENSNQYQAGQDITVINNHYSGLTKIEATELFRELFVSNFPTLRAIAKETAEARATELNERLVDTIASNGVGTMDIAADPGLHYAIIEAQHAYARTGDRNLSDILVQTISERAKCHDRNIVQIACDEAIRVAPKLSSGQIDALTTCFVIFNLRIPNQTSLRHVTVAYSRLLSPIIHNASKSEMSFLQLTSSGAATNTITRRIFASSIRETHPGLCYRGRTIDDLKAILAIDEIPQALLRRSEIYPDLFSYDCLNVTDLETTISQLGLSLSTISRALADFTSTLASNEDIERFMSDRSYATKLAIQLARDTELGSIRLTTTGMAIAIANLKAKCQFPVPISQFLRDDN